MPELNRLAPDFELRGLDGSLYRLSDYRGRIVVVNFWSADCPHVVRTDRDMLTVLARWGDEVVLLTIASNVNESAELLGNVARARGLPLVLIDAGHVVADLYAAQVTPEVFVVDRTGVLRYRGAVDNVNFRQPTATRSYLNEAVESLLAERPPPTADVPAFGCSILRES